MDFLSGFLEIGRNVRGQPVEYRADFFALDAYRGRIPLVGILVFFCPSGRSHVKKPRSRNPRKSISGNRFARTLVAAVERRGRLAGGPSLLHDFGQDRCGQRGAAGCVGRVDRDLAGVLARSVCNRDGAASSRRPTEQSIRSGRARIFRYGCEFLAGRFAFGATWSEQPHAMHFNRRRTGNDPFSERLGNCVALSEAVDCVYPCIVGAWNADAARSRESRAARHAHHANQFLAEFSYDFFHGRFSALSVLVRGMKVSRIECPSFPRFSRRRFSRGPCV